MRYFRLTEYGRREIVVCTLAVAAVVVAAAIWGRPVYWAAWPAAFAALLILGWMYWFFRDPDRLTPSGSGLFVSPADGRVSDITPVGADSALGCEGLRVGVFMSVFDVHVNRCPCDGEVASVTHLKGAFLDARNAEAPMRNASTTVVLSHRRGERTYPIAVRQVAGLIARRIVTDLAAGDNLARGRRIGMIKFGSRVELLVPRELVGEVCVAPGRKVVAGQTVLIAAAKEL